MWGCGTGTFPNDLGVVFTPDGKWFASDDI
jgi:hypothetical protein